MMKNKLLSNDVKSYIIIFIIGILVGVLTRLTDFCGDDTLWSFSSVATTYGFWIISLIVITLVSSSNLCAGVGTFLYMFGMTLSFYGLKYLLGLFLPMFDNGGFQTNLFIAYSVLALVSGVGAFILYYWERPGKFNGILYALPLGALLAETVGTAVYLFSNSTFLFQFLLDLMGVIVLGIICGRRSGSKVVYIIALFAVAAAVYFMIYQPALRAALN